MCLHPKSDPAVAVTGRHWKSHTDFCTLLAFSLMDQMLWLMLFPAPLHPLNLIIIWQRQPHTSQQPYNNRVGSIRRGWGIALPERRGFAAP